MALDHLVGNDPDSDDAGLAWDWAAFIIASALSLLLAVILFGRAVPRTKAHPDRVGRAAKHGLVYSVIAVVATPFTLWIGLPFVVAGAGIALGLLGRGGDHRRLAIAAILLGAVVLLLDTTAYVVDSIRVRT
jgi:hypothetical protein